MFYGCQLLYVCFMHCGLIFIAAGELFIMTLCVLASSTILPPCANFTLVTGVGFG